MAAIAVHLPFVMDPIKSAPPLQVALEVKYPWLPENMKTVASCDECDRIGTLECRPAPKQQRVFQCVCHEDFAVRIQLLLEYCQGSADAWMLSDAFRATIASTTETSASRRPVSTAALVKTSSRATCESTIPSTFFSAPETNRERFLRCECASGFRGESCEFRKADYMADEVGWQGEILAFTTCFVMLLAAGSVIFQTVYDDSDKQESDFSRRAAHLLPRLPLCSKLRPTALQRPWGWTWVLPPNQKR